MIDNPIYEGTFDETVHTSSAPDALPNRPKEETFCFGIPSNRPTRTPEDSTVATSPAAEYKYENVYLEDPVHVANAAANTYDIPADLTHEEAKKMVSKYENTHFEVPTVMGQYDIPREASCEEEGSTEDDYTVMSPATRSLAHTTPPVSAACRSYWRL